MYFSSRVFHSLCAVFTIAATICSIDAVDDVRGFRRFLEPCDEEVVFEYKVCQSGVSLELGKLRQITNNADGQVPLVTVTETPQFTFYKETVEDLCSGYEYGFSAAINQSLCGVTIKYGEVVLASSAAGSMEPFTFTIPAPSDAPSTVPTKTPKSSKSF